MPEFFNPLDFSKWRDLIEDFDAKRVMFFDNLAALNKMKGATPELEKERQSLIKAAGPIQKNIDRLMSSLEGVRGFFKGVGDRFGLGEPSQIMGELGVAPFAIAIGLGAAAVIVRSISDWLVKTKDFAEKNKLASTLADAGATPNEIIEAIKGQKVQPKIFGLESGGLKWVFAIGALILAGPYLFKEIGKRV